jgi:hypothetical protein
MKRFHSGQIGIFGLFFATAIFLTLVGCSSPAASEPDDFRGIKWGANSDTLSGFNQIAKEGNLSFFEKTDDQLQIDDIKLDQVIYGFNKGRFYTAMIYFPAASFSRVQEIMTRRLGKPSLPDNTPSRAMWDGPNVSVLLTLGNSPDSARLAYLYKPIQLEVELNK